MTSTATQVNCADPSPVLAMPEGLRCWIVNGVKSGVHHATPSTRSIAARLCRGTANGFEGKTHVFWRTKENQT